MREILILAFLLPGWAHGFTVQTSTIKSKSFMVRTAGGVFEALDLVSKTYTFNHEDADACAAQMKRQNHSLAFSCKITLNAGADQSKLRVQLSQPYVRVFYGGLQKAIHIDVSEDARTVTFSTRFDDTGIDYQVIPFNEEFLKVEAKSARDVILEAMILQPLEIQVLESARPDNSPGKSLTLSKIQNPSQR